MSDGSGFYLIEQYQHKCPGSLAAAKYRAVLRSEGVGDCWMGCDLVC